MKKERCLSLLMVTTLISVLIFKAGCGGAKNIVPNPSDTSSGKRIELLISAAASIQDSLQDVAIEFSKHRPNVKLITNYGSSGALQQQIEQGAPVDLFISAGQSQMEALVKKQLVKGTEQAVFLSNQLVIVVPLPANEIERLDDLRGEKFKRIAIGDAETVPAGSYAKDALIRSGLWETIQTRLIFTKDVRQVLSYVESGNVDAGFVYRTDAFISGKVKAAYTVSPEAHRPIEYTAGIVAATKHLNEAKELLQYLKGPEAMSLFEKHGFARPMIKE